MNEFQDIRNDGLHLKVFVFRVVHVALTTRPPIEPLGAQACFIIGRMLGPYRKTGGFRGAQAGDQILGNAFVAASAKSEGHDVPAWPGIAALVCR